MFVFRFNKEEINFPIKWKDDKNNYTYRLHNVEYNTTLRDFFYHYENDNIRSDKVLDLSEKCIINIYGVIQAKNP